MKKLAIIAVVGIMALPSLTFASFDRNLKYGMRGNDVSDLQEVLIDQGCLTGSATGYFGLLTLKGVKCFQTKNNIQPVSGFFGALSRGVANSLLIDDQTSSNEAEIKETGTTTPVSACSNGAKFNYVTGQPCQPDNTQLLNQITQLQTQVSHLQTTVTQPTQTNNNIGSTGGTTVTPPVLEDVTASILNVENQTCFETWWDTRSSRLGTIQIDSKKPFSISKVGLTLLQSDENLQSVQFIPTIASFTTQFTPKQVLLNTASETIFQPGYSNGQFVPDGLSILGNFTATSTAQIRIDSIKLLDGRDVKGLPITFPAVNISWCKIN